LILATVNIAPLTAFASSFSTYYEVSFGPLMLLFMPLLFWLLMHWPRKAITRDDTFFIIILNGT